jgi:hypothetical protein
VILGGFAYSDAFKPDDLQSMQGILLGFHSCAKCAEPKHRWLGVRVPHGSPKRNHSEPHSLAVERFEAMVRFEHRAELAELPDELVAGRDVCA